MKVAELLYVLSSLPTDMEVRFTDGLPLTHLEVRDSVAYLSDVYGEQESSDSECAPEPYDGVSCQNCPCRDIDCCP